MSMSCSKPAPHFKNRAFYYWKTTFEITAEDRKVLDDLRINKLYVRMFDVVYDETAKQPKPVRPLIMGSLQIQGIEIIPVVYIMQDVFRKIDDKESHKLAADIVRLTRTVLAGKTGTVMEFQSDYDWVPSTKEKYFHFLTELKRTLKEKSPGAILSATIRLHQVKYKDLTGVPPIDRGMLMAYNMMDIRYLTPENTTFDVKELKKYVRSVNDYPLKLDLALPIFPSFLIYENNEIKNMLTGLDVKFLGDNDKFQKLSHNMYMAKGVFSYKGEDFSIGDIVKVERISLDGLKKAVKLFEKKGNLGDTICIFHCDTGMIREITDEKIDSLGVILDN